MPPFTFTVRAASPRDAAGWSSLRSLLWQHVSEDDHNSETQRLLAGPHRYANFIAFSCENSPIGFVEAALRHDYVNGCKTSPVLFLEGIYVVPAARRVGVARALCSAAGQWGSAHGCTEFASDSRATMCAHTRCITLSVLMKPSGSYFSESDSAD
jgi:aminoglycoside 6'-N-acetyltransferase I